jgi:FkbM family methyltransferase
MTVDNLAWGYEKPSLFPKLAIAAARLKLIRGGIRDSILRHAAKFNPSIDCELDGLKIRAYYSDNMTERGIAIRSTRGDTTVIDKIVSGLKPGDIFLDVGANIGWISLNAARLVGTTGRVIAVEPIPELQRRLVFNARSNGFDNITVVPAAVGDESGSVALHVNPFQQGMSSIAAQSGFAEITVPLMTLEQIISNHCIDRIDAMKIDAEGHEDRIILPFIESAPRALWPRRLFLERRHSDRWNRDCISCLSAAGYALLWSDHSDALLVLNS